VSTTTQDDNRSFEIKDLNQFVKLLFRWHSTKVKVVEHMMEIPDTAEVTVNDGEVIRVNGDFRKGFQLGITIALSELGALPFVAELEEAETAVKH